MAWIGAAQLSRGDATRAAPLAMHSAAPFYLNSKAAGSSRRSTSPTLGQESPARYTLRPCRIARGSCGRRPWGGDSSNRVWINATDALAISFDGLISRVGLRTLKPGTAKDDMASVPRKGPYSTTIGGMEVRCESADDAAAIERAANILARIDRTHYSPEEIDRLATVLTQYGRGRAARVLRARATFG